MLNQALKLVTGPANLAVSVQEAKDYLRVDESAEDGRIELMIRAATSRLENLIDCKFITQTWDYFLDNFPTQRRADDWWDGTRDGTISALLGTASTIKLPIGPLQSVTSFETISDAETTFVFDPANYALDTSSHLGRISLRIGSVWPATVLRANHGIKIRAVVGFAATSGALPSDIRQSILGLVGMMYEHRGDELPKIPAEVIMLIEPYRRVKIGC